MAKITTHELLDPEDVQSNIEEMYSYAEMREHMVKAVKSARGSQKLYLQQVLDVLDLSCQSARSSDSEIEAEIYSILS